MDIGLDFDGVIAYSEPLMSVVAKKRFNLDVPVGQFKRSTIVDTGILTLEEYRGVWKESISGAYPIEPVVDALKYIHMLLEEGHSIRVVTTRLQNDGLPEARTWMSQHGLSLSIEGVGYDIPKTEACRGLDLYVDDSMKKLLPLIDIVPRLLFFAWLWNIDDKHPRFVQVVSWNEIYRYIQMQGEKQS